MRMHSDPRAEPLRSDIVLPSTQILSHPNHPDVSGPSSTQPNSLPVNLSISSHRSYQCEDENPFVTPPRRRQANSDSFIEAAQQGARAQSALDAKQGRVFDTYHLGKQIISCSKLYANQRRSNRILPGGSDSTTAACYMIGGTSDQILQALLTQISPCDPREERCKAVERVLKDKTRGAICALNGENPREARADNLAAVRICETVADILVAYSSRSILESQKKLSYEVQHQNETIKQLREQLKMEKDRRETVERDCWCKGSAEKNHPSLSISGVANNTHPSGATTPHRMRDFASFERNKLVVRGNLSSSGFRSHASGGHGFADALEKEEAESEKFSSQ